MTTQTAVVTIHPTALDAKIAARTIVHRAAQQMAPKMLDALKPFVGSKVLTVDGALMKRVANALPEIGHNAAERGLSSTELNAWYSAGSGYSIVAHFKACQSAKTARGDYDSAHYDECSVDLGHVRDGVLTSLEDEPTWAPIPTAEAIRDARARLTVAEKVVSEIKSELCGFVFSDL